MRFSFTIAFALALILLSTACNLSRRPIADPILTSTTVPTAAPAAPAATRTPAPAAAAVAPPNTPVTAAAAAAPTNTPAAAAPAPTNTAAPAAVAAGTPGAPAPTPGPGTPGPQKLEEMETPTTGEEQVEGAPQPNALATLGPGGNPLFAPVAGVNITVNGPAASMKGTAMAGMMVFNQSCASCHGPDGKGGVPNPGSDDGTVPPLNPVDPAFKTAAKGEYSEYAGGLDLFIQHGSRPSGDSPSLSMVPWGDQKRLTQQQIADVEAYIIQLNGGP